MSARVLHKATSIFPYLWGRSELPSPGSQNLTFLTVALPHYNPIGAGWQTQRQLFTMGAQNTPRLVGVVGPGGYPAGQVFNPPLIDTGN